MLESQWDLLAAGAGCVVTRRSFSRIIGEITRGEMPCNEPGSSTANRGEYLGSLAAFSSVARRETLHGIATVCIQLVAAWRWREPVRSVEEGWRVLWSGAISREEKR